MNPKGAWLGQIPLRLGQSPLILGPSSWGAGMLNNAIPLGPPQPVPPFYGEWGVVGEGGTIGKSGRVGPFDTIDEAFNAAAQAAIDNGATELPTDGFAQVKDSRGQSVGPVT